MPEKKLVIELGSGRAVVVEGDEKIARLEAAAASRIFEAIEASAGGGEQDLRKDLFDLLNSLNSHEIPTFHQHTGLPIKSQGAVMLDSVAAEAKKGEGTLFKNISEAFKDLVRGEWDGETPRNDNPWARTHGKEVLIWYPRKSRQGGYSDHSINMGWLGYHNIRDLLARFFLQAHKHHGRVKNWREHCIGITSKINSLDHPEGETGWHMPMFDYDGKNIKTKVKKDIKKLQKEYGLGDASIFTTQSGLHVYFFLDMVPIEGLLSMLETVSCCRGFIEATRRNGYAVLRVSAKYTEFDIAPYKTIISPNRSAARPGRKAALIQGLLRLGQECGTHFASLYPQWAYYREDRKPWKPPQRRKTTRRVRKISKEEIEGAKKKKLASSYAATYGTIKWDSAETAAMPSYWGKTTINKSGW